MSRHSQSDLFHHMFGAGGQHQRPIETFIIPKAHIRRLYELMDEQHAAAEKKSGTIPADRALWQFIESCVPASRGRNVRLNTMDIMQPMIEVIDDKKASPTVGKNGVIALYEATGDFLYKFIELCDREQNSNSPTVTYDLWCACHEHFALPRETPDRRRIDYSILLQPEWTGVVAKLPKEDE